MHSAGNETDHVMLPCTTWPDSSTQTPTQAISDFLPTFRLTIDAERTTAIMPRDVKAYLASKKSETSDLELAQEWAEIEELYSKRYFCGVFLYT